MRLSNPTNRNTQARTVNVAGITLYFSYETLVGVRGPNGIRRDEENYSNTTRKHMREMGIYHMPEMEEEALQRYAEISIMTNLMEEHLPITETDNET